MSLRTWILANSPSETDIITGSNLNTKQMLEAYSKDAPVLKNQLELLMSLLKFFLATDLNRVEARGSPKKIFVS